MYAVFIPTNEVYGELKSWWEHFKWQAPPLEHLPKNAFYVPGVCAVFLYETGTSLAFMEWMISSPTATPEQKGEGIAKLVEAVSFRGREIGVSKLATFTPHRKLIARLEGHGFKVTEEHTCILMGDVQ